MVNVTFHNSSSVLRIGQQHDGWIDEIRITKDLALYRGSFTPPSSPLTIDLRDDVIIIPQSDLGSYEDTQVPPKLIEERIDQEVELPRRLDLIYIDQLRDYQEGSQNESRISEILNTDNRSVMRLPIVMSAKQAKRVVEFSLYNNWLNRRKFKISLSPKHIRIDPGDYIQIPIGNKDTRVYVESIDYGGAGTLVLDTIRDDGSLFNTIATGIVTSVKSSNSLLIVAAVTRLILMDIPLLRDRDENAGFYLAAGGGPTWKGASIFRSTDGTNFSDFLGFVSNQNSIIGIARTALPDGVTTVFDTINSVTIRLINQDFSIGSKTELQVLNGENVALLGSEIIQWKDVIQNPDGSFILSNLLRGRRGSEFATASHVSGEIFVILTTSTTKRRNDDLSQKGLVRFYKVVSIGQDFEDGLVKPFINNAIGLKPYSPVHITSTLEISPNGIKINWFRRTRIGGAWLSNIDIPLSETSEDYEIDILDDGSPTVVRTITKVASANGSVVIPASKEAFYHDQDHINDFGSVATRSIKIYQLSSSVGRGFAGDATI